MRHTARVLKRRRERLQGFLDCVLCATDGLPLLPAALEQFLDLAGLPDLHLPSTPSQLSDADDTDPSTPTGEAPATPLLLCLRPMVQPWMDACGKCGQVNSLA